MSMPEFHAATEGEIYVALADNAQEFPAIIDDQRRNGFAVPRFRRPVAEAVTAWLNGLHEHNPEEWPDTVSIDGDVLMVLGTEEHRPEDRIEPDENGRYSIDYRGCGWEITEPPIDWDFNSAVLADSARLMPQDGEILVTINIDGTDPAFPAVTTVGTPRFRRPVAEAVVAWINGNADGFDNAYWDGDTVVMINYQEISDDGYLPVRISADDDGRYTIGANFRWERPS